MRQKTVPQRIFQFQELPKSTGTKAKHTMSSTKQLYYKITQMRSIIGMPPIVRKNIQALGLRKRFQTVYQKVSPSTAHRLMRVKELVAIDLVDEPKSSVEMAQERKYKPGFEIIKAVNVNKTYE